MSGCHICETVTDDTCPECHHPTCEDHFETLTQFNAGWPLRCETCARSDERQRHADASSQAAKDAAAKAASEAANARRRATYHSPEAKAKREQKKRQAAIDRHNRVVKSLERAFRFTDDIFGRGE